MEYSLIPASRYDDVINLLRKSFSDEPITSSVGLTFYNQPCPLMEKYHLLTLQEGLSIMALNTETGEVAGVALNGTECKGDVEQALENLKAIDSIPYKRVFGLLYDVNEELDLYTRYNVDKLLDLRILSVDSKYRGKGLGKELVSRSELIAKEHGYKLMKLDATSYFTQKICDVFGMEVLRTIRYEDYKDENGKKIFPTKSPHEFYKVIIKQLPA